MNRKKFNIDKDISVKLEQLNYICLSYKSLLSILAREFSESTSKEASDMIEKYRIEYQNYYIEFSLYTSELITSLIGFTPTKYDYNFDFHNSKVDVAWE